MDYGAFALVLLEESTLKVFFLKKGGTGKSVLAADGPSILTFLPCFVYLPLK